MRFRNTKTGAEIEVPSMLKGPWERIDGGAKPAAIPSEPSDAEEIKKPAKKTKKATR